MKRDFSHELTPEIREKTRKNLVYVAIFSIVMMFGGFTSAYIVSMGDSFWLKYPMPSSFWISTAIIILSSIFLQIAIAYIRKGNQKMLKVFISLTLLFGIAFMFFQIKGYKQLISFGAHPINNHIIVTDGRYGDYYEIKYKGNFIEVNGNDFFVKGKKLTPPQFDELKSFMRQFVNPQRGKSVEVNNYGKDFILYYNSQPLGLINGKLSDIEGNELQYVDEMRLRDLAINIQDERGDFFVRGEIGKDFNIYYKGKALEYKNRELHYQGKKLSKFMQIKAMETSDTASSYLYIITVLHLLHVFFTVIYMLRMTIASFSGKFSAEENLALRTGAIFWHFLGLLWIYLLLFLLFIH